MDRYSIVAISIVLGGCSACPPDPEPVPRDAGTDSAVDLGDPCDCATFAQECAVSGFACGVGINCTGFAYRNVDGGRVEVPRTCPVPLTREGKVIALCLDGNACVDMGVGVDGGAVERIQ